MARNPAVNHDHLVHCSVLKKPTLGQSSFRIRPVSANPSRRHLPAGNTSGLQEIVSINSHRCSHSTHHFANDERTSFHWEVSPTARGMTWRRCVQLSGRHDVMHWENGLCAHEATNKYPR